MTLIVIATRLLDRFARNEALSGDLLEQLHSGHTTNWYVRQVFICVIYTLAHKVNPYVQALTFSLLWSGFTPAVAHTPLAQFFVAKLLACDLPYSSGFRGIVAVLPMVLFLWAGFFVYACLHNRTSSPPRVLFGLSLSVNIFASAVAVQSVTGISHSIFLPASLSLFSALACVLPQPHRRSRGAGPLPG